MNIWDILMKKKLRSIGSVFKLVGLSTSDINEKEFIYDENPHKTMTLEFTRQEERLIYLSMFFLTSIILLIIYFFGKNHQIKIYSVEPLANSTIIN